MNKETQQIIHEINFEKIVKHPNILIAARFWDDRRFHAAKVCYQFMRMIDDYVDDRKALGKEISYPERGELSEQVNHWIACLDKMEEADPFYSELMETVSEFRIPLPLFQNFANSMLFDIDHDGFDTLDQFLEYSEGSAVAPASIFVHLCCLKEGPDGYVTPEVDVIEAARPCALFSYIVHIIRDFQKDQLSNLNYFATDILQKHRLAPSDLKVIASTGVVPDSFREVIRQYLEYARYFNDRTLEVMDQLSSRLEWNNFLSLKIIYHLYKLVFDRIDPDRDNFTTAELNPTPLEIKERVMEVVSELYTD